MKIEIPIHSDLADEILIRILKNIDVEFWDDEPEYKEKLKDAIDVVLDYFGATVSTGRDQ